MQGFLLVSDDMQYLLSASASTRRLKCQSSLNTRPRSPQTNILLLDLCAAAIRPSALYFITISPPCFPAAEEKAREAESKARALEAKLGNDLSREARVRTPQNNPRA